MVAGTAGETSAKGAKGDEAKEEEDPLVRRKEEVVRLLERARAKGKGNARAKKELLTLCADFEAKNEKLLGRLLPELWSKIVDENLHQNDLLALAMTCRFFREKQKDLGKEVETSLNARRFLELLESGKVVSPSLGWFQWVCDNWEILPGYEWSYGRVKGAVYEGYLLNYAAFQGSVEISRWLVEEKGCKLNGGTGWWAGMGGSVEVLEYLEERGYEYDEMACSGAAMGGHLEALKYLRGLDPPCPWNEWTCTDAAVGGHLEVLKWLRLQDPPCPWNSETCVWAAEGGHLEVLKWLRSQDPPCPWSRFECIAEAMRHDHLHIVTWIDQQEDESDVEDWEFYY
ncbi:putative ankyrin repeat protein [Chloropicon roscoffensis]|uniref:Ankyrin repeat protein n=1 Tax=Chloropicon roscoffensis TaxID=1461544 RepID=A0AAX4PJJ2_9CHLO